MSYSLESLMASTGRSQQAVAAVEATDQRRDFVEAVLKREARQQDELLRVQRVVLARREPKACLELLASHNRALLSETQRLIEAQQEWEAALIVGNRWRRRRRATATEWIIQGAKMGRQRTRLQLQLSWVDKQRGLLRDEAHAVLERGTAAANARILRLKKKLWNTRAKADAEEVLVGGKVVPRLANHPVFHEVKNSQLELVTLERQVTVMERIVFKNFEDIGKKEEGADLDGKGLDLGTGGMLGGTSSLGLTQLSKISRAVSKRTSDKFSAGLNEKFILGKEAEEEDPDQKSWAAREKRRRAAEKSLELQNAQRASEQLAAQLERKQVRDLIDSIQATNHQLGQLARGGDKAFAGSGVATPSGHSPTRTLSPSKAPTPVPFQEALANEEMPTGGATTPTARPPSAAGFNLHQEVEASARSTAASPEPKQRMVRIVGEDGGGRPASPPQQSTTPELDVAAATTARVAAEAEREAKAAAERAADLRRVASEPQPLSSGGGIGAKRAAMGRMSAPTAAPAAAMDAFAPAPSAIDYGGMSAVGAAMAPLLEDLNSSMGRIISSSERIRYYSGGGGGGQANGGTTTSAHGLLRAPDAASSEAAFKQEVSRGRQLRGTQSAAALMKELPGGRRRPASAAKGQNRLLPPSSLQILIPLDASLPTNLPSQKEAASQRAAELLMSWTSGPPPSPMRHIEERDLASSNSRPNSAAMIRQIQKTGSAASLPQVGLSKKYKGPPDPRAPPEMGGMGPRWPQVQSAGPGMQGHKHSDANSDSRRW